MEEHWGIHMQGFFLVDAAAHPLREQHECDAKKFCFAVSDKELRHLVGRLEASLSKEELGVLRDSTCPSIGGVADSPEQLGCCDAPVRNPSEPEQPCATAVADLSSAVPTQESQEDQNQQSEVVQRNAQSAHDSGSGTFAAGGLGVEVGDAQACLQKDGSLDIKAWYWGGNSAKQTVPQLPRCAPFKPPPTPPKHCQQHDQAQGAIVSQATRRHRGAQGGATGNMPGQAPRTRKNGALGDGKKGKHVPQQGAQRQQQRHGGHDHAGGAVPGRAQHGRLPEQDGGGKKKRAGRFVRELDESAAADRDNKVELGFNANLKQFEKTQRDKGVFQNRKKRATVYTISGGLAHDTS